MAKKELVTDFLKMLFENKVREAYAKHISADFIHHNQWFKGDRESLMLAMEEAHNANPHATISIKQILEENDFVMTHSHVVHGPNMEYAAMHIFRIKGDKIVELWDSPVQIDKNSPNKNGPF